MQYGYKKMSVLYILRIDPYQATVTYQLEPVKFQYYEYKLVSIDRDADRSGSEEITMTAADFQKMRQGRMGSDFMDSVEFFQIVRDFANSKEFHKVS